MLNSERMQSRLGPKRCARQFSPYRVDRYQSASDLAQALRAITAFRQPNPVREAQVTTQSLQVLSPSGPPRTPAHRGLARRIHLGGHRAPVHCLCQGHQTPLPQSRLLQEQPCRPHTWQKYKRVGFIRWLAVVFPARGDFIRKNTDFNPLPIGQQAGLTVFPALNRG